MLVTATPCFKGPTGGREKGKREGLAELGGQDQRKTFQNPGIREWEGHTTDKATAKSG